MTPFAVEIKQHRHRLRSGEAAIRRAQDPVRGLGAKIARVLGILVGLGEIEQAQAEIELGDLVPGAALGDGPQHHDRPVAFALDAQAFGDGTGVTAGRRGAATVVGCLVGRRAVILLTAPRSRTPHLGLRRRDEGSRHRTYRNGHRSFHAKPRH